MCRGAVFELGGPALIFISGAYIAVLALVILILRAAIIARVDCVGGISFSI
jgi:hypothetical protein